ncbi:MAG: hypothetical protein ACFB0C_19650 [Leptolyngbyaceae cyanobacterium]
MIIIEKRSGDYKATLGAQSEIWGCGADPDKAIADLMFAHPQARGIQAFKYVPWRIEQRWEVDDAHL